MVTMTRYRNLTGSQKYADMLARLEIKLLRTVGGATISLPVAIEDALWDTNPMVLYDPRTHDAGIHYKSAPKLFKTIKKYTDN